MDKALGFAKRWVPLIILVCAAAYAYRAGWHQALSLESLQAQKQGFQDYADAHGFLAVAAFMGAYIASVALSLPIATLLTLLGGFLFGKWLGTFLVVSAATIGAVIIFLIAKTSLGAALRARAGKLYDRVAKNMEENAMGYLFFMRLVPVFPFVLVNVLPALFNVPLRVFVVTTFFGIIPGSFVYVNLGETLGDINSLGDLVSPQTVLSFGLLGVFALIPTLYKQLKNRRAAALVILTVLMSGVSLPASAAEYGDFIEDYDGLLKAYTRPTSYKSISYRGVDYVGWAQDGRHEKAKEVLLSLDPENFKSREDKLAFWINAYNFLTIDLITQTGEGETIKNLGTVFASPWDLHKWEIAGKKYTLDDIEHKILRPMGEARIHFAINCAAISCPDLRGEAYRANGITAQLNEQAVLTLNNASKGYSYDRGANTARVSKIFDWFGEDFRGGDVRAWLDAYKPDDVNGKTRIEYLDYDWALNKVR